MATPSLLQSKPVVGGRCKALCICFHPHLPSFSSILCSSVYLTLPPVVSLPLSAGNRCPASPHKYLLITITGDSWSTQTNNLRVHIQFSHIHSGRGQMGLLRRRVTDYFEFLLGCLVKAPGLQNEGPQETRGGDEKQGGKRIRIKVEKRRKDGKSQRWVERRWEEKYHFRTQTLSMMQSIRHTFIPVCDFLYQTTVLVTGKYLSIHPHLGLHLYFQNTSLLSEYSENLSFVSNTHFL